MKEFENIVLTGYAILLIAIAAFMIFRYRYYRKTSHLRINISREKNFYRFFRYISIVAIALFAIGFINYVFILQKGNLFAPYWAKLSLIALMALLLITEIRYNIHLQPKKVNRIFNLIFSIVFLGVGFLLNKLYFNAIQHPDTTSSVIIDLPFKGTWIASGAGASGLTNHHDRIKSQKYAVDIIKFGDDGKLFKNEGVANEDSYTFGAEIISPVDGTVVHVTDSLPDRKIKERDKLAGNHIIIQFRDTLFVALAHLKQNSIRVKQNDNVRRGDVLAQVGNSGNTDFPHLHIHVQNSAVYDIESTTSFPFRFRKFKRMRYVFWNNETNQFLLSNDIVKTE
jgi:hypothetical protein